MSKLKNLFLLAFIAAAGVLLMYGCTIEEDEDPVAYTATIVGGTATFEGDNFPSGGLLFKDDVITLTATAPAHGQSFLTWTVSPADGGTFNDATKQNTTFRIGANNVTITATYGNLTPYTATIVGGTGKFGNDNPSATLVLYAGDVITLTAEAPARGEEFARWSTVPSAPANSFNDETESPATFRMPANNVEITAHYDDLIAYTVEIQGGTGKFGSEELTKNLILYEGDQIDLVADALNGAEFKYWNVAEPAISENPFNNKALPNAKFTMPEVSKNHDRDFDLTISAEFTYDGMAEVRFSWKKKYNDDITHVSASVADIAWWVSEVLNDINNDPEDFLPIGIIDPETNEVNSNIAIVGNPGVTESIFTPGVSGVNHHGKYYETTAGHFLSVLGVQDEYGLFEIVADYTIDVHPETASEDGTKAWFEIGFDIGFAKDEGEDEYVYWFKGHDNYETPTIFRSALSQHLNPLKKKAFVKKLKTVKQETKTGTMNASFYLIRKAK